MNKQKGIIMRNQSAGTFKIGDTLYDVNRFAEDGKLHLSKIRITDIIVTKTPTGRDRKPIYKATAINFTKKNGETELEINPDYYYDSATNAVSATLRHYFERKCGCQETTPEERLLKAVFGEEPNPRVAATELVDVIYDLKNFHALYAEAFSEDDKKVQQIEV